MPTGDRDTPTSRWEAMEGKSMSEKLGMIKGVEDKAMRDSLLRKWKDAKRMDALNISEREKIIKSLGISDGARADYIYSQMQQSETPEQVLQNYIRKGVATKEVVRQIKLRSN